MIYKNLVDLKDDFNFLVKNSSLDYVFDKKIDDSIIEKYNLLLNKFDDKFILKFFKSLVKEYNFDVVGWKNDFKSHKLPVIILLPNSGLKICTQITPDNKLKLESKIGTEYISELPIGAKILEFNEKKDENDKISAKKMFMQIALKQKKYLIYALLASFSINIFALVTSLYSMQVYDRVIPTGGINTLISLSVGAVIAILLEMILKVARSSILDKANKNMDMEFSHNIFDNFLKIRCDSIPKSVGLLSGQLQSYSTVRNFISTISVFFLIDLPFALFFLVIIITIGGYELGLIIILFLFFSTISGALYKNKIDKLTQSSTMSSYKKLGLLVETVENIESIKSTYNGWKVLNRWNRLTYDNIDDDLKVKHFTDKSTYITTSIQQISYIALIATGAYIASTATTITIGSLIAVSILSGRVFSPFASIPNLFISWGRAKMSIKDLNNIYNLPVDNNGMKKSLNPVIANPDIICENILFSYNEDSSLLKINSLKIISGEKVGILGVIGSGKSTLLKILAGLYKAKEGTVKLNGIDIQQISREKIAKTIGYLPQNVKLLSGTLRENLTLGMTNISDDVIIESAKHSGLINLINSLPKGIDTTIPDGSECVSSGQRQLIGITRLIIQNPDIWLLDEPTANIDEMSERLILKFFDIYLKDKTVVIISHKQSVFTSLKRLIIMSNNSIVLDGNKDIVIEKLNQASIEKTKVGINYEK